MKRKILSLDGGGIKGAYSLGFLAQIEDFVGVRVGDYFDLIVGTSTGGIIALGLGRGFSANELLEFYSEMGERVFSGVKIIKAVKHWGLSKYNNKALKECLEEKFGETRLWESEKRLVIPSQHLETGEVYLYKTAHNERFRSDYKVKMSEIAMATAAAPTYFPTYTSANGVSLVDGGVYANNPVALAAVEAIGILNWPMEDINILSIGCTNEAMNIVLAKKRALGRFYWAAKSLSLIMKGQSSSALGMANHLVNYKVHRIDDTVARGKFALDSVKSIQNLMSLGRVKGRHKFQEVKDIFFDTKVEKFDSIYKLEDELCQN